MKILNTIGEAFADEGKSVLSEFAEVTYVTPPQERFADMLSDKDAVLVGLGLNVTKREIDATTNLKVIATATTGLDHIDVAYAKEKGVEVLSLKGENDFLDTITGTAELAFGLMIAIMRLVPQAYDAVHKQGLWQRDNFKGLSLYNKTLGIVGMGRLGKIMAAGAAGFRMNVIFTDPNVGELAYPAYEKVSLEELLKRSDVVAIHVHLSPETENMFGTQEFAAMKRGAYLINTSRGKIVDEAALQKALEDSEIAGYATDVLDGELDFNEDASEHPLVAYAKNHDNVLIVPHIGGMTHDSRVATDLFIAEKLRRSLQG